MFRFTDLETRVSLNMNVLDAQGVPGVLSLGEVLNAWLEHRKEVLVRRSTFRLNKIEKRLHLLAGYLIAYLNLDEVIRIIREEDEPKQQLMKTFKLSDEQAEAILNMRLRSLRRLEEMEIKTEDKKLKAERKELKALLKSDPQQWKKISDEIKEIKANFGQKTELGKRRTSFADAPTDVDFDFDEVMTPKEPITVICSNKGWIRALKGHVEPGTEVKYKEGDRERFRFHAETTDKLILLGTNGRFYTIGADKLPGGRGNGEPVRLMIDLEETDDVVDLRVYRPGEKLIVASDIGNGFIVDEDEVIATKRGGKRVLNVSGEVEAKACAPVHGDHVAVIGDNRKLILFPDQGSTGNGTRARCAPSEIS